MPESQTNPDSQPNLAWELVLDLDAHGSGPLHQRVKRALRAAIRAGAVPVGAALPPSRSLAADLGCSRSVVTEAYSQLVAEGYLEARTGSATRVRWAGDGVPAGASRPRLQPEAQPRLDLAPGLPDLRAFPRQRWLEALRAALADLPSAELGYPHPDGHWQVRQLLADYLTRSRGANARDAAVMMTTSATHAVRRICRALVDAGGTRIGVEDPGWTRLHAVVRSSGLETVPVPVDAHGIDVAALERLPDLSAVIVTPAHQFPTGVVLHPQRRAALLRWAERTGGLVVEDDYDAEFRYDRAPVSTLQGMAPQRVVLVGSLSKTLTPALRIGWLLAPTRWAGALQEVGPAADTPSTPDQLAFAGFLAGGDYERYLRASRRRYRARRDALVAALGMVLPDVEVTGIAAGLHVLAQLPADVDGAAVTRTAARQGLRLVPLEAYRHDHASRKQPASADALVLGYGNLADSAVPEAVTVLAHAVDAHREG